MALVQINRDPTPSQLRWFSGLWLPLAMGVIGFILWRKVGHNAGYIAWGLGVLLGLAGLAVPAIARAVWIGWMTAAFPIGFVVSHVILFLLWALAITPIGLIMRAAGKDPMKRQYDRAAATYWEPFPNTADKERYFKQY